MATIFFYHNSEDFNPQFQLQAYDMTDILLFSGHDIIRYMGHSIIYLSQGSKYK